MTKLFLISLFSFFTSMTLASEKGCHIELFSKVYRLEANQALTSKDLVYSTNCENAIVNKLAQLISTSNGTLAAQFLKSELARDFQQTTIEISPRKVSILDLGQTLRDQLTAGSNLYFLETKSLNGLKSLGLVEGEQLKATCESCNTFGEKTIKLDLANPATNSARALWFTSRMMAKINVYKAKRNLSFQQKHLEASDFYQDEIFASNPENLVTTLDNIQFFKANRTILQGSAVSNFDLQPVNLINYGTPVNVILQNQNISLQRSAIPTRSGLFGDTIELRNPANNKTFVGKVVDYNKVVIEL